MEKTNIGKLVEVIADDDRYQFSHAKVGDICRICYEFETMFIVVRIGGVYDSHGFAVDKKNTKPYETNS